MRDLPRDLPLDPDLPGYTVSDTGVVTGPRGVRRPQVSKHGGHLRVNIRGVKYFIHHLVLRAFGFERPEGAVCRHLDGDPTNNSLSNLTWGTPRENYDDGIKHGSYKRPPAPEDIFACKYLHGFGLAQLDIADVAGIHRSSVHRYLNYA